MRCLVKISEKYNFILSYRVSRGSFSLFGWKSQEVMGTFLKVGSSELSSTTDLWDRISDLSDGEN